MQQRDRLTHASSELKQIKQSKLNQILVSYLDLFYFF